MTKPRSLDPLADEILTRLCEHQEASENVLGGYFALPHYVDYRRTYDIDALWRSHASKPADDAIRSVMTAIARERGFVYRERRFGDTLSFEFLSGSSRQFSFQISVRSVTLDEPLLSAWPPIAIDTVGENISSNV